MRILVGLVSAFITAFLLVSTIPPAPAEAAPAWFKPWHLRASVHVLEDYAATSENNSTGKTGVIEFRTHFANRAECEAAWSEVVAAEGIDGGVNIREAYARVHPMQHLCVLEGIKA